MEFPFSPWGNPRRWKKVIGKNGRRFCFWKGFRTERRDYSTDNFKFLVQGYVIGDSFISKL